MPRSAVQARISRACPAKGVTNITDALASSGEASSMASSTAVVQWRTQLRPFAPRSARVSMGSGTQSSSTNQPARGRPSGSGPWGTPAPSASRPSYW